MPNKETSLVPTCKECSERTVDCHGTCEAYQNYSDQRKEINARRTEDFKLRYRRMGKR